jgi:hypothetical protein
MPGKGHAMRVKMAIVAVLTTLLCAGALARELPPDLRSLIEGFQAHRRVAVGYLRTQNGDLGAAEIERLQRRWSADRRKLSPQSTADGVLATALARTETLVADGLKAADGGDVERARALLEGAAGPLDAWRKANDIRLFSDCIADITAAYERLDGYRLKRPDLADGSTGEKIVTASDGTIAALERCDREAPDALRREPEFRRLFDGMLASLRQMPEVVRTRDGAQLHRLLIEQRSFERLLSFRFG